MVVKCDNCETIGASSRCSACKVAIYCNSTCAAKHWKSGHKNICKAWVDNRKRIGDIDKKIDDIILKLNEKIKGDETCCICLESTLSMNDSFFLPCRHFLCGKCIYKLPEKHTVVTNELGEVLETEGIENATCPLCRAKLPEQNAWLQYLYQSACELIQRANRLPAGNESRMILCSYARSQSKLIDSWFVDQMSDRGISTSMQDNHERMKKLLDILEVDIRLCEGNGEGCLEKAKELLASGKYENSKDRRIDLLIKVGESYMLLGDFEKATSLGFLEAFKLVNESMTGPTRKIFHELIRCFYEVGNYSKALGCGEAALDFNKHYDGLYKYIALSHKALGNLEQAIDTMNDAVVYEAPWNEAGKAENRRLLEELRNELQQQQK